MKSVKIKDLIDNHSVIENDELYELRKKEKQFHDICMIVNYSPIDKSEAERLREIEHIIFSINYRKDVLSKISR